MRLSAVAQANVHQTYIDVIDIFSRTMAFEPDPLLRNPEIAEVLAEMRPVSPNPAEILQGYYSGAITDWRSELRSYNAAMTAERERAIERARSRGANVSINDWIFPNWNYGMNFTTDSY